MLSNVVFKIAQKVTEYNLATFKRKFATETFQKLPNLVTLAKSCPSYFSGFFVSFCDTKAAISICSTEKDFPISFHQT